MQVMTQLLLWEIDLSLELIFQPAVSELLCCHIDILMETEELASMQLLRAVQAGLAFFLLLIHLPGLLRGEEEGEAGEDDEEGQGHHPCPLIGISVVSGYCSSSYCVRQLISCSPFLPPLSLLSFLYHFKPVATWAAGGNKQQGKIIWKDKTSVSSRGRVSSNSSRRCLVELAAAAAAWYWQRKGLTQPLKSFQG